jgi:hypothetical protein
MQQNRGEAGNRIFARGVLVKNLLGGGELAGLGQGQSPQQVRIIPPTIKRMQPAGAIHPLGRRLVLLLAHQSLHLGKALNRQEQEEGPNQ